MNPDTLRQFILAILLTQVMLCAGTLWAGHSARQDQIMNARTGCERSKLDRQATVVIANSVYRGFLNTDRRFHGNISPTRRMAEMDLRQAAISLASRSGNGLDCKEAFPDTGWFPWEKNKSKVYNRPILPPPLPLDLQN